MALRTFTENHNLAFGELLSHTNYVTIHIKNLQSHVTEFYESINGLSPPILENIFTIRRNPYNLWKNRKGLETTNKNTNK